MVDTGPAGAAAALASLEEAVGIMESMMKANPTSPTIATQLTLAREYAGHRLESLGQTAAAERQYSQSLEEAEALSATASTLVLQTVVDEEALALLHASTGESEQALIFAQRALSDAEKLLAANPSSEDRAGHLARANFVLASVYKTFGDWVHARPAAERALAIWAPIRNTGVLALHSQAIAEARTLLREPVALGGTAPTVPK